MSVRGIKYSENGLSVTPPLPMVSIIPITGTSGFDLSVWTFCSPASPISGPRFIASHTMSLVCGTLRCGTFCGRGYFSITFNNIRSLGWRCRPASKMDAKESWTLSPTLSPPSRNGEFVQGGKWVSGVPGIPFIAAAPGAITSASLVTAHALRMAAARLMFTPGPTMAAPIFWPPLDIGITLTVLARTHVILRWRGHRRAPPFCLPVSWQIDQFFGLWVWLSWTQVQPCQPGLARYPERYRQRLECHGCHCHGPGPCNFWCHDVNCS